MAFRPKQALVEPAGGEKITKQRARQGQNVKGMVTVLVVSLVLVVAGFAIMMVTSEKAEAPAPAVTAEPGAEPQSQP